MTSLGLKLAEAEAVRRVVLVEARRQQAVLELDFVVAYYIVRLRASRSLAGTKSSRMCARVRGSPAVSVDLRSWLTQELPHRKLLFRPCLPSCPVMADTM